jgi:hypothetical protein
MLNGRQAIESRGGATSAERSLAAVNDSASAFRLFTEGDDLTLTGLAVAAIQKGASRRDSRRFGVAHDLGKRRDRIGCM